MAVLSIPHVEAHWSEIQVDFITISCSPTRCIAVFQFYFDFIWQFVGQKNSSKCGISARL